MTQWQSGTVFHSTQIAFKNFIIFCFQQTTNDDKKLQIFHIHCASLTIEKNSIKVNLNAKKKHKKTVF